ncbi:MAG: histidine--tRNA ligase [Anaerolineales bacterium]|nr:histidine--tRNA ligase [Anaerolineales bacterium]
MSMIQPVRGTRDFYPEDMAFRSWLHGKIRSVSEAFGYQEYDGPFLERLELYAAKSGEELVKEQAYVFKDRGGSEIALRPELTPSLARMVAQHGKAVLLPLRWWSFGPFWRYERTQKGRSREFFQWNIDLIGVDTPAADAEVVAVGASLLKAVGLTPELIRIKVNNRRLVESQLGNLGISGQMLGKTFQVIDRREKMDAAAWRAYASDQGLSETQLEGLEEMLGDLNAWKRSEELVSFFASTDALGVSEFVEYDPTIIRGLDYYTGTVYEARDVAGNHRAILGGGRYDDLVSAVGGDPISATGFAMGDVVFQLVLEESGALPEIRSNPANFFVTTFDDESTEESMRLATELRSAGFRTEWYPEAVRLPRQFKYADRQGIPFTLILGPEEIQNGTVAVKDMHTGEQENVAREELITYLERLL